MSAQPAAPRHERADKARNRARILEAASEAFAETGADTQMDAIAARAGVGVGTLYRHFATKEALMIAMVERKFAAILEVTLEAVDHGEGAPFDVLAGALRAGSEIAAADSAAQDALARVNDVVWVEVAPTLLKLRAATQILMDRAQAAGTLRPDISAEDVPMIMCGVSSTMGVPEWEWRRYLEIILAGMRPQSDTA